MVAVPFFLILLVIVILLVSTASQSRRYNAMTDQRLCRQCGTIHPPFAQFCRRCGAKLLARR